MQSHPTPITHSDDKISPVPLPDIPPVSIDPITQKQKKIAINRKDMALSALGMLGHSFYALFQQSATCCNGCRQTPTKREWDSRALHIQTTDLSPLERNSFAAKIAIWKKIGPRYCARASKGDINSCDAPVTIKTFHTDFWQKCRENDVLLEELLAAQNIPAQKAPADMKMT